MVAIVQGIEMIMAKRTVPVWGMTDADELEREPAGYRPSDMLPGAKRLLCIGVPVPRGIFMAASGTLGSYWRAANIYYRNIDATLLQACQLLEEQGDVALPIFG